jgi:hypothetical protein
VQVVTNGQTYRITRLYGTDGTPPPAVAQRSGDDWAAVDVDPADVIELAAFSQGEILEHAREPVGRMSLVDAGIDLGPVNDEIARLDVLGRHVHDSRLIGGLPPMAEWRR